MQKHEQIPQLSRHESHGAWLPGKVATARCRVTIPHLALVRRLIPHQQAPASVPSSPANLECASKSLMAPGEDKVCKDFLFLMDSFYGAETLSGPPLYRAHSRQKTSTLLTASTGAPRLFSDNRRILAQTLASRTSLDGTAATTCDESSMLGTLLYRTICIMVLLRS